MGPASLAVVTRHYAAAVRQERDRKSGMAACVVTQSSSFRYAPRGVRPESITTIWGYGFRVRDFVAPRNDKAISSQESAGPSFPQAPAAAPAWRLPSGLPHWAGPARAPAWSGVRRRAWTRPEHRLADWSAMGSPAKAGRAG